MEIEAVLKPGVDPDPHQAEEALELVEAINYLIAEGFIEAEQSDGEEEAIRLFPAL